MAKRKRGREGAGGADSTETVDTALPAWLPWCLYGALSLLLFGAFVFSNQMLFGSDTMGLGYMARHFYASAVRSGDFPLWSPNLLGGVPFLEAMSGGDSLYPTALLLFVIEPYRALGWKLVLHVFLAGIFMHGWTRSLGATRAAALVAGTGYLLAPFMVTLVYPGHDGKLFVTALTPLLFWAMESTFHRKGLLPHAGIAGVVALVILTTHFQMAYFLFGAAGLYYAFRCVQEARERGSASPAAASVERRSAWTPAFGRFGSFLTASILGACIAGVQLMPAVTYATEFSRRTATTTAATPEANKEYAGQWSLHPEEVVALVVPEFVGSSVGRSDWTTNTYWGRNFFKLQSEYVGLVVLLLAGVSFFGSRRRGVRLFLAVMGGLALLYALGPHTPVWHSAYALLPGIRLFRAASMVVFLFGFAAVTLSAFGVDRLLELKAGADPAAGTKVLRFLWVATGLLGLGFLLSAGGALGPLWTSLLYRDISPSKAAALVADQPYLVRGFLVATVLAVGTAGLTWATVRGQLKRGGLVAGLVLLVMVDLWRVNAPFIQMIDPERVTRPGPLVEELVRRKEDEPPFRVANVGSVQADQDVTAATFGIELAGGHHPNDLARYRELIGMEGSGSATNRLNPNVLRVLNVRYLIWPTAEQGGEPQGMEVVARSNLGGQVHQSLLTYPGLPRARLVGAAEVVPDSQAVERILAQDFDPALTALLVEPSPVTLSGAPVQGDVRWAQVGFDRLELTVQSTSNALLVVADNWYPAWKATVDGIDTPVLRAYHTLRAVPVGPGEHEVVMWYDPGRLRGGMLTSVFGLLVLLAVVVVSVLRDRRRVGYGSGD